MKTYQAPLRNRSFRWAFRPLFRLVFHILGGVKLIGRQNVPPRGAYIITMNHVSLYDPPFLLSFWPVTPEAAGAVDIWGKPGQGLLVRMYGGIPVHRGEYDRQVLETMIAVLRAGKPLLLAPEGGRSHVAGLRRAFPGVAYLVDKTAVPVVPVGIVGTTDDYIQRAVHLQRPRVEMRIGVPVVLPPVVGAGAARRAALQANADRIMAAIAALLPAEYRGIYESAVG